MLVFSNIFMTFAWYGHLKLSEMKISTGWPLILVILFSWGIAFFEYCLTVPANRIGFAGNGGPFNLLQLKHRHVRVPWRVHPLEPHRSLRLPGAGRFLRLPEINSIK